MTDTVELKPCPFCGDKAEEISQFPQYIQCSNEDCVLRREARKATSGLMWIDRDSWNTRQIAKPVLEELRKRIEELRRKHNECEDCWYSCPKSKGGCCDDNAADECNCGADKQNTIIDAILASLSSPHDKGKEQI